MIKKENCVAHVESGAAEDLPRVGEVFKILIISKFSVI